MSVNNFRPDLTDQWTAGRERVAAQLPEDDAQLIYEYLFGLHPEGRYERLFPRH